MAQSPIRFEDGAAYDQGMGRWSALAGQKFLEWLAPQSGMRWIDIGCGSGAFTELLVQHCAPAEIHGVDPSDAQLQFARSRETTRAAVFQVADAMALPFPDNRFDAAVMALVIFFVPDPAKGVAEMMRVVRPGGTVAAYAWDFLGGGWPFAPILIELRSLGFAPPLPPSVDVSRMEVLRDLWQRSGLEVIDTTEITVERTFADFDDFWAKSTTGGSIRPALAAMTQPDVQRLKERLRARLPADPQGRITYGARANAVKGYVPA